MQLEIDLVDILLDAALGKEQLSRKLAVGKPPGHQTHDLILPLGQGSKIFRAARPASALFRVFPQLDDPRNKAARDLLRKQGLQIAIIFHKGHDKAIRLPVGKRLRQQASRLLVLAQHLIGRRCLDADMQRYQRVVHGTAHGQLPFAAADHRGISALRQIDLIFDQVHHRLARGKEVDRGKLMIGKNGRDPVRLIQQGVNISVGGVPDVQPCGVVVAQQRRPAFLRGAMPTDIPVQGEPPRQKIAAQRHVLLTIALDLRIGAFEANVRVCEAALHKVA